MHTLFSNLGSCGSDEALFSCSNNRCIDKKFVCENLNPCGDNADCPPTTDKPSIDNIMNILQYVIGFCFFGITFCMFFGFARRMHNRGSHCPSPVRRCCNCCGKMVDCCGEMFERIRNIRCDCCRDCCGEMVERIRNIRCDCCGEIIGGIVGACRCLKNNRTSDVCIIFLYLTSKDKRKVDKESI